MKADLRAKLYAKTKSWWLAPGIDKAKDPFGGELARIVTDTAIERETRNMPRRWRNYCYHRMITGRALVGTYSYGMARRPANFVQYYGEADWSVMNAGFAASMLDVYVNRMLVHDTFLDYVPERGNEEDRQRAEEFTAWIEDVRGTSGQKKASVARGLAAFYYGSGFTKFIDDKISKKPCAVEKMIDELLFATDDEPTPYELIDRVWLTRTEAIAKYAKGERADEIATAILEAPAAYPAFWFSSTSLDCENVIAILEAYIEPRHGEPGRHALVIGKISVIDETWSDPLPYEREDFHQIPGATFGQGLAEILLPFDEWINEVWATMHESDLRSGQGGKWLVEENSNVNTDALGGLNAASVTYAGTAPKFEAYEPIGQWANQRLNMLYQEGMKRAHVNINALQGDIPKALDSAVAIERYAQIDDANFAEIIGRRQEAEVRDGYQLLRSGKRLKTPTKKTGRVGNVIDWDKVHFDGDHPVSITGFNTGRLGQTIAGKTEQLEKMRTAGDISRELYLKYLQLPDLGSLLDDLNAPVSNVAKALDKLVISGKYTPPSPFMNLAFAKQAAEVRIDKEEDWGSSPATVDRIRMWRAAVVQLIKQQGAAAGAATGIVGPTSIPGAPVGPDKNAPGAPVALPGQGPPVAPPNPAA